MHWATSISPTPATTSCARWIPPAISLFLPERRITAASRLRARPPAFCSDRRISSPPIWPAMSLSPTLATAWSAWSTLPATSPSMPAADPPQSPRLPSRLPARVSLWPMAWPPIQPVTFTSPTNTKSIASIPARTSRWWRAAVRIPTTANRPHRPQSAPPQWLWTPPATSSHRTPTAMWSMRSAPRALWSSAARPRTLPARFRPSP